MANIAVVGATGNVGREVLSIIGEMCFSTGKNGDDGDGFVVDKGGGSIVGIEGEGYQQARGDLSAEPYMKMLFQVAGGHQVTDFGVG